ncbi:hypothetical protein OHA84_38050 (plasmid) [Streptomyces sp. NBC_00513]|uniref:hypothetical protein n=1 Tax=unclassified Streptomyces TaxID=2593676 RepID=UPI00225925F4|nr:hypothetical protein [Streptomyces sp. NBC_00424]MCX5078744.1 hypothetical protein [Streptomyces sp. NBC_00424]WUD46333.1 hypothetical protein OHA84_38050 [Streptomyces sp. NBC_00513]
MYFTALAELPSSLTGVDELRRTEAGWEHGPDGVGYAPLCNLVRGCGAPAEWVIEHPSTCTRRFVCRDFHTVEVAAVAVACWVTEATELAEYLAGTRE